MKQTLHVNDATFTAEEIPFDKPFAGDKSRISFRMKSPDGIELSAELTSRETQLLMAILSQMAGVLLPGSK